MATATWPGLDIHSGSTQGAALDTPSGELSRRSSGAGSETAVAGLERRLGPQATTSRAPARRLSSWCAS